MVKMSKKSFVVNFLLSFVFVLGCFCSCKNNSQTGDNGTDVPPGNGGDVAENVISELSGGVAEIASLGFDTAELKQWGVVDGFSLSEATIPVWDTKNVYNETVGFVGKADEAKLLYAPTKIHKVYDYYFGKEFEENVDYTVSGNTMKLTADTRINYWKKSEYYNIAKTSSSITLKTADGYYLSVSEVLANAHQICVSYEHNGKWTGARPVGQSEKFPLTLGKLKEGEAVNIGVVGDSITVGCGSSGFLKSNEGKNDPVLGGVNPYFVEGYSYIKLIEAYLSTKFSTASVTLDNKAIGGKAADNGVSQVESLEIVPDLVIIAFGMNDAGGTVDNYVKRIKATIEAVLAKNAQAEILLVSSMLPNPELVGWTGNIPHYEQKLVEIAKEYKDSVNIAVAPMTSMSESFYDKGKRSYDMNSSNVNHPNDFIHRVYAQTVLKVLLGDDYTAL